MILTIAGKELKSLFASPLAWVVLTVMQLIIGFFFLRRLDDFLQLQSLLTRLPNPPGATQLIAGPVFGWVALMLVFAVPLLAMRLVAGERRAQTMVLLVSAPVSMTQIVLGKFLGIFIFLLGIVGLTALMPLLLAGTTQLDYGLLAGLVIGLTLLAASLAAVSLYISCLTTHPVVAAIGACAVLLLMILMGEASVEGLRSRKWALAASLAQVVSPFKNFEPFAKGVFDSYALACFSLTILFFLALAARHLDAQRLRG